MDKTLKHQMLKEIVVGYTGEESTVGHILHFNLLVETRFAALLEARARDLDLGLLYRLSASD